MSSDRWTRPESVPYPSVWSVVEGRRPLQNGKVPRFRIQDIPPQLSEAAVRHMALIYMRDAPYLGHLGTWKDPEAVKEMSQLWRIRVRTRRALDSGTWKDPEAVEEMSQMWRTIVSHKAALIAIVDNPEELEDPSLPLIAGVNMTDPKYPDQADLEFKSYGPRHIKKFANSIGHKVDVFKKYNVAVTLCGHGLSVDPVYRGHGLGVELLKARFTMGRAIGLPLTTTVFSGDKSQAAGRSAGLTFEAEGYPEDYTDENGVMIFKGVKSKSMQLQAARIQ